MRRAAARLFFQLVAVLAVAAVVAALWALARAGAYGHSFGVACLVFGGLALLFGAFGIGGMSRSLGLVETAGTTRSRGPLPGMPAFFRTSPGATPVNSTPIFLLTGIVMIVLGFCILG